MSLIPILLSANHLAPPYPFLFISPRAKFLARSLAPFLFPCRLRALQVVGQKAMATATATLSPATISAAAIVCSGKSCQKRTKVNYISGLNSFGGLKAQNNVVSLGLPVSTEQCFAKIVSSLNHPSRSKGRGGGALSSTCDAAGEIFRIAAIISALVLVGVAVGFVLLRIEAFVEESE